MEVVDNGEVLDIIVRASERAANRLWTLSISREAANEKGLRIFAKDGAILLAYELIKELSPEYIFSAWNPNTGESLRYVDFYINYQGGVVVKTMIIPKGFRSREAIAMLLGRRRKGESGLVYFFNEAYRAFKVKRIAVVFDEKKYLSWHIERLADMVKVKKGAYLVHLTPPNSMKVIHLAEVEVVSYYDYRAYL